MGMLINLVLSIKHTSFYLDNNNTKYLTHIVIFMGAYIVIS